MKKKILAILVLALAAIQFMAPMDVSAATFTGSKTVQELFPDPVLAD